MLDMETISLKTELREGGISWRTAGKDLRNSLNINFLFRVITLYGHLPTIPLIPENWTRNLWKKQKMIIWKNLKEKAD